MKIDTKIKDWQVAQVMLGKNGKEECRFVKILRRHCEIKPLDETWSIIYDTTLDDDCGWLIPNELSLNVSLIIK